MSALDDLKADPGSPQTADLLPAQDRKRLRCRAIEWLLVTAARKMAEISSQTAGLIKGASGYQVRMGTPRAEEVSTD